MMQVIVLVQVMMQAMGDGGCDKFSLGNCHKLFRNFRKNIFIIISYIL
jgi:hypothetical protein